MKPDESAVLVDAAPLMAGDIPRVLHATYRVFGKREDRDRTTLFIVGPTGTDGAVRLYSAGRKPALAEGRTRSGEAVALRTLQDSDGTVLIRFPYHEDGVGVRVQWE